jgi:spore germination protein KC
MKMKKISICILTIVMSLQLTGCWDHNEVNKLAIVVALGIDKIPGPNPYLVSAQIVNPATIIAKEGSSGKPFFTASVKGNTISEAIHKFSENSPRRFFFSHTAIIVLGDKLARSETKQTLDYFARERQFRRSIWLLVTPKTAQEILQSTLDLEKIPGVGIEGIILQSKKSTIIESTQRKDFIRDITSKSHAAVISKLDLVSQKVNEAKGQKKKTEGSAPKGGEAKSKSNLQLKGEAVFNKEKLVGYLTDAETRGLLWILGKMQSGPVAFRCQKDKKVVLNMKSTKSSITPSFNKGKLKVSINIQAEGILKDVNCAKLDVSEIGTIKKLETLANKKIEQDAQRSVLKAQYLKSDIFGFGNQIYRDYPEEWGKLEKNWDQKFSQMEVDIHVTSLIRQLGVITGPLEIEP